MMAVDMWDISSPKARGTPKFDQETKGEHASFESTHTKV